MLIMLAGFSVVAYHKSHVAGHRVGHRYIVND